MATPIARPTAAPVPRFPLSRRAAFTRLGGAGLGAMVGMPVLHAVAHDATPEAGELLPVVAEYVDALEVFDLDRLMATFAQDATCEDMPTGTIHEGRDAIRAYLDAFGSAFSDVSVDYTTVFAAGLWWAAGEWTYAARYTGQLEGLPPGAGQEIAIRGVDILELGDGMIQHVREYVDLLGFLAQLGALSGMEGGGEATLAGQW